MIYAKILAEQTNADQTRKDAEGVWIPVIPLVATIKRSPSG